MSAVEVFSGSRGGPGAISVVSPVDPAIVSAVTMVLAATGDPVDERRAIDLAVWAGAQADLERALGELVLRAVDPPSLGLLHPPAVVRTTPGRDAPLAGGASRSALPLPPLPPVGDERVRGRSLPRLVEIGPPTQPRPVVDPEGLTAARLRVARAGLWVRNLGIIILLLLAYQWYGTGFEHSRAQARLRSAFAQPAPTAGTDNPTVKGPAKPATPAPGPLALPGGALAEIRIPAIHVDQIVVEGTSTDDLRKGPGHYAGTPEPGQHGNVAIAGHRTTYGAPFNRLGDLRPGDSIVASTRRGTFLYTVSGNEVVSPGQTSIVDDYGDDRLTLTTCTPEFTATQRLVVIAKLEGPVTVTPPVRSAAPPRPAPVPVRTNTAARGLLGAVGRGFDTRALMPALLVVGALIALALLYRPARQHLPVAAAAALLAPLWLCGLLLLLEQLNRFLPPNV